MPHWYEHPAAVEVLDTLTVFDVRAAKEIRVVGPDYLVLRLTGERAYDVLAVIEPLRREEDRQAMAPVFAAQQAGDDALAGELLDAIKIPSLSDVLISRFGNPNLFAGYGPALATHYLRAMWADDDGQDENPQAEALAQIARDNCNAMRRGAA
jgi:hypothetical protein